MGREVGDTYPDLTAPQPQSVNCQSLPLARLDRKLRARERALMKLLSLNLQGTKQGRKVKRAST